MKPLVAGSRYAVITSTLALVIALGGGAAVAAGLITSKDIKDGGVKRVDLHSNAVNSKKVVDGSLSQRDLKASAVLPQNLPSGRTLTGTFGMYGHGEVDNGLEAASESISFPIPLKSAPDVVVVQQGTASSPPECPGTAAAPEAAPGWLCVYENRAQNQRSGGYPISGRAGQRLRPKRQPLRSHADRPGSSFRN